MAKEITYFVNNELKPRLYNSLPNIFPEYNFKNVRGVWKSELHADGREGSGKKEDRCVVTPKHPDKIFDNTEQKAYPIIDLYAEKHHLEFIDAVKDLCTKVGIHLPELTPESKIYFERWKKTETLLEASAKRQRDALFTPEGKATLDYIRGRGWTDEEIKAAGLGYISPSEAKNLNSQGLAYYLEGEKETFYAQDGIGTLYTLSIPLYSGSTIYGFKCRTIDESKLPEGRKDKYLYLKGTKKSRHLFNLTGIQQTDGTEDDKTIVVVEGELDTLHAEVRGVKGLVATGGGKLTEELLSQAKNRGIERIILLFDKDEKGQQFTRESIDIAHKKGISLFVATYPKGVTLDNGKPIHDIDEYLQKHTPEELKNLIGRAVYGSQYLLQEITDDYSKKNNGSLFQINIDELTRKVYELANETQDAVERSLVIKIYSETIGVPEEAVRAMADELRAAENAEKKSEETKVVIEECRKLAEGGEVEKALQKMGEAALELRRIGSNEKYSHLLATPSEQSLLQRLKKKEGELPTGYELNRGTDKEVFTLPCGAITFICAPTSHGKSTFLQNLALQVAKGKEEGAVLYFTFEEDGDAVTLQMLNKFMNVELCRNYNPNQSNNIRAIKHYYKTGEDRFIAGDRKALFKERKEAFMRDYYTSGKIRIYYEDYDSAELIEAVRTISRQTKVKAVFIDYIQLLSSREYKKQRLQRTEELKEICKDFKNLSIETQLPIVVAAQLNREANSPLELHSQKIAEAADLERIANKILCLWNTSFEAQKSKDAQKELDKLQNDLDFKLGEGGKIYAKLTKNRGGVVNLEAVFNYNGNTGVIEPNYTQTEQEDIPVERDKNDIF